MEPWQFGRDDMQEATDYYRDHGFVGFPDLLTSDDVRRLHTAYSEAVEAGHLNIDSEAMVPNPDAIERHEAFNDYCCDLRIVDRVAALLGQGIELQHAKLNAKPGGGAVGGAVAWHQDWPFFPHTNFDLLACTIHLDSETEASGPLEMIPGSHKWGPRPHEDESGVFVYGYMGGSMEQHPSILLTGDAGLVTMHHVLSMHRSAARTAATQRRHLIFQYRAEDAVQLAGVVTKCAGTVIRDGGRRGFVRFPNGESYRLRGHLIDPHLKFAPDR